MGRDSMKLTATRGRKRREEMRRDKTDERQRDETRSVRALFQASFLTNSSYCT